MAHLSGLIAGKGANDPFEYADVVTSTTHKSLRGPRSGMIFCKKELADTIDFGVFPMLQGGPHNHQIAGLAAQLKQAATPEFEEYIVQVKANAKTLADDLMKRGYKIISNGTDNHIVMMSCIDKGLTGSKFEYACDQVHITLNKNTIIGDKSAITPGGIRIGTPAVTTRGYNQQDMGEVARFLDELFKISLDVQATKGKKLTDFKAGLVDNAALNQLGDEVHKFSVQFDIPGFDASKIDC
jgi:glycine hydroxymethyltransferase